MARWVCRSSEWPWNGPWVLPCVIPTSLPSCHRERQASFSSAGLLSSPSVGHWAMSSLRPRFSFLELLFCPPPHVFPHHWSYMTMVLERSSSRVMTLNGVSRRTCWLESRSSARTSAPARTPLSRWPTHLPGSARDIAALQPPVDGTHWSKMTRQTPPWHPAGAGACLAHS